MSNQVICAVRVTLIGKKGKGKGKGKVHPCTGT